MSVHGRASKRDRPSEGQMEIKTEERDRKKGWMERVGVHGGRKRRKSVS